MRKRLRLTSIVTALLLLLAFPGSGQAGTGSTAPSPTGSSLGKTTATIVGDATQFRPCSFEATFTATDVDSNFSLFQKASGMFPPFHRISGSTLSGDHALSEDLSTCDIGIWASTVWAVDGTGASGEASDPLILECRKDRDDIPTAPRFSGETRQPRLFGAGRSQPTAIGGTAAIRCCFNITLSSSTPGGERDLKFIRVSGDLPPGHRLSGDTIRGCTATPGYISGDTTSGGVLPVFTPRTWVSEWITRNRNNRCETSGRSTLTLTCDPGF